MNALSLVFVAMHQLYALRQENTGVKGLGKNTAKTDLKKQWRRQLPLPSPIISRPEGQIFRPEEWS